MGTCELDKFVLKFKQLWLGGQEVELHVKSHAGQAWVTLNAALGVQHTGPHHQSRNGPARQRRRERRAAERKAAAANEQNTEEVDVVQVIEMNNLHVAENATKDINNALHTSSENEAQHVAKHASKDDENVILETEIAKLKTINAKFEEKLNLIEKEKEDLKQSIKVIEANQLKEGEEYRNVIAVQDMLHESLKEDMQRKYGSEWDEESDLESEEENDELQGEENKNCKECNFIGKSKGGLKTHVTRKHIKEK